MDTSDEQQSNHEIINDIVSDIGSESIDAIRNKLGEFHPAETASVLESMPPSERKALWEVIPVEQEGEILTYMGDEARTALVENMDQAELLTAAGDMNVVTLTHVLKELPDDLSETLMQALDDDHRLRLETALSFEEGTAGRLMNSDVVSVRENVSLAVVARWIRRRKSLPSHTDALMVTDGENHYLGKLELADVLTGDPNELVAKVMKCDADTLNVRIHKSDIAVLFEQRDLISVAVIDDDRHLLGRISIDEILGVIREQGDAALLKSAGLKEEEDLFAPVVPSAKRRGVWLGINLITVFLAAWVIGQFEEALDKIVALAVLMPIVASMGGIAGSQTLTLTIRGLALNQIARSNIRWLTIKEIMVGGLNGLVWSITVALVSFLWFNNAGLALILAVAMMLNLLAASLSGVIIPLVLTRLGIDPALSGAVILTTVTDVIGFLSFLGLATLYLL